MKYRPDIDGLRAIAVLLVLFYHAHFSVIASGFIGVDVFFVISGFLITQIILNEMRMTQKFRFINFYKKRLWRLMPVLIVMLIVVSIVCYIVYLPADLIEFVKSMKSVMRFQSNSFFGSSVGGYFASNANFFPLLHTWSLSIEWQWYGILPFLLLALVRTVPSKLLPWTIICLWLFFLGVTIKWYYIEPMKNYYFLSGRIFELLTGSVLVILPLERFYLIFSGKMQQNWQKRVFQFGFYMIGIAALFSIGLIAVSSDVLVGFPNYYAIWVSTATAILIALGLMNPHNWVTRVLCFKPLVLIGLISYSLYIWHWPIFAVIRYIGIEEHLVVTLACLALSFILGFSSWYFLERPARMLNKTNIIITFLVLLIIPMGLTKFIEKKTIKQDGFPNRFELQTVVIEKKLNDYKTEGREKCLSLPFLEENNPIIEDDDPLCLSGVVKSNSEKPDENVLQNEIGKRAFLFGDSFGNHLWGFLDVLAKDANLSVLSNTTAACLALPGVYLPDFRGVKAFYEECEANKKRYFKRIAEGHYDFVILGQKWSHYLTAAVFNKEGEPSSRELVLERIVEGLDATLALIVASGATPVILSDTVIDPKNGDNQCFYQMMKLHQSQTNMCDIPLTMTKNDPVFQKIFETMQIKYPSLIVIDPKVVQCANEKCIATIENIPIYFNTSHLTDFASFKLGEAYLKLKGNPLKLNNDRLAPQLQLKLK